jgi:hypothetical protein
MIASYLQQRFATETPTLARLAAVDVWQAFYRTAAAGDPAEGALILDEFTRAQR